MAIDITLAANTPTATLELRQAQAIPDGSGYAALLVVRSGGLAAALPFFVTGNAVRELVHALDAKTGGVATPARLSSRDGSCTLVIEVTPGDELAISGQLAESDDQQLRFRFLTHLRGAGELAAGLRALLAQPRE